MMANRDQLAGFHETISGQLNARLAESPRFFWALVVVSTGYGYVLWNYATEQQPGPRLIATFAAILSYLAILWASWYLAALGYAFRFLQNCQHSIEHALGWDLYAPKSNPPPPRGIWWLLPGIYHAHVFGLFAFLGVVFVSFCWLWRGHTCAVVAGIAAFIVGLLFIPLINQHYLRNFRRRRRDPSQAPVLNQDEQRLV